MYSRSVGSHNDAKKLHELPFRSFVSPTSPCDDAGVVQQLHTKNDGMRTSTERAYDAESERHRLQMARQLTTIERERLEKILRRFPPHDTEEKNLSDGPTPDHEAGAGHDVLQALSPIAKENSTISTILGPISGAAPDSAQPSPSPTRHSVPAITEMKNALGDDTPPHRGTAARTPVHTDNLAAGPSIPTHFTSPVGTLPSPLSSNPWPPPAPRRRRGSPPPAHDARKLYRSQLIVEPDVPPRPMLHPHSILAHYRRSPLLTPKSAAAGSPTCAPVVPGFSPYCQKAAQGPRSRIEPYSLNVFPPDNGMLVERHPKIQWDPQRSGNILIAPDGQTCLSEAARAVEMVFVEYGGSIPEDIVMPMYALGTLGVSDGDFIFQVHLGGPLTHMRCNTFRFAVGVTTQYFRGPQSAQPAYLYCSDGTLHAGGLFDAAATTPYGLPYTVNTDITVHLQLQVGKLSFYVDGKQMGVALRLLPPLHPEPLFPCVLFMCEGDSAELVKPYYV